MATHDVDRAGDDFLWSSTKNIMLLSLNAFLKVHFAGATAWIA